MKEAPIQDSLYGVGLSLRTSVVKLEQFGIVSLFQSLVSR